MQVYLCLVQVWSDIFNGHTVVSGILSRLWPSATLTNAFPSPQHHSQAHKLTHETLHSFPTPNTSSRSCLITSDPIGLNPIACTYFSLVLVPCLSLPHICYSTSTSFPPSDSLSSPSPSTLYHLTLNCLFSYPRYILCSSPYIRSPIPNLSRYVSLSAHSCNGRILFLFILSYRAHLSYLITVLLLYLWL